MGPSMSADKPTVTRGLAAIFCVLAITMIACVRDGYQSITIDPATLRVDVHGPLTMQLNHPRLGSYYLPFTGANGTSVEHFFRETRRRVAFDTATWKSEQIASSPENLPTAC